MKTAEAMRQALDALELAKEQLAGDRLELIACHAWPAGSGAIPEHDRAGTQALREYDECLSAADAAITALRDALSATPQPPAAQQGEAVAPGETVGAAQPATAPVVPAGPLPEGFVIAPHFRGFANLGIGAYLLNHSAAGEPAELIVSIATEAEKAGRVVGDERENPDGHEIQPEVMAVRLRFANVAGLDALEQRLRYLRAEHFPGTAPAAPVVQPLTDEQIVRAAVAAMPATSPLVADDLLEGHTMHTEMEDIVAIWKAAGDTKAAPVVPQPAAQQGEAVAEDMRDAFERWVTSQPDHQWTDYRLWKAACAWQATQPAAAPQPVAHGDVPPVLVRDLAEIIGVGVPSVCAALLEIGRPPRSTNMAIGGEEAVAVAKRLAAAPAGVVGEPVAEIVSSGPADMPILRWLSPDHSFRAPIGSKLYTAPPARQALTDEQIRRYWSHAHNDTTDRGAVEVFTRLVERAHGIDGKEQP